MPSRPLAAHGLRFGPPLVGSPQLSGLALPPMMRWNEPWDTYASRDPARRAEPIDRPRVAHANGHGLIAALVGESQTTWF